MSAWKRDSVFCVLLLSFLAVLFTASWELKPVARKYPQVLITVCAVLSVALLIKCLFVMRVKEKESSADPKSAEQRKLALLALRDVVLICAVLIAYVLLIKVLGYITSTVLFIVTILLYLRVRKWYILGGVSLGSALFLYYMFNNLLGILLPAGLLI